MDEAETEDVHPKTSKKNIFRNITKIFPSTIREYLVISKYLL